MIVKVLRRIISKLILLEHGDQCRVKLENSLLPREVSQYSMGCCLDPALRSPSTGLYRDCALCLPTGYLSFPRFCLLELI